MCFYFVVSNLAGNSVKNKLNQYGNVIEVFANKNLSKPVQCHPDMQITPIDETTAVFSPDINERLFYELESSGIKLIEGKTRLSDKYPENIAYNVLKVGKTIYHNTKYTDSVVKEIFNNKNYIYVHVNQGYAGCSSIYVKNVLLTNDRGIEKAVTANGYKCFCFDGEDITLKGYDRGFIGGCSGYNPQIGFIVSGAVSKLKEGSSLIEIINENEIELIELDKITPEDIGGIQIYII